ncbi:ubiquitin C-terminal hydrolase [Enterococcus sp. PF1-24]|nr:MULTISPECIES: hypothetical protein [unclassified Enterococcus]MDH6364492.1 ubiquitin C-terminal hydrolase [Enterococcus sp. PFB1-1]MDH6401631.1 ubiquitin C-terminal hydrolase [Enterococcus sp. PF1-24]
MLNKFKLILADMVNKLFIEDTKKDAHESLEDSLDKLFKEVEIADQE